MRLTWHVSWDVSFQMDEAKNTSERPSEPEVGFWERQFCPPCTASQRGFDLALGIIAPVVCLYCDPIVFCINGPEGSGLLSDYRVLGFSGIAVGILALAYHLLTRRASAFLAGLLWGGFYFSFALGIVMLPVTLLGLLLVIGILGFTPFLTGYVFLRNARRCWRDAASRTGSKVRLVMLTMGLVLMLGMPVALQGAAVCMTNRAIAALQSDSEQDFARAVKVLRAMRFFVSPDRIASAHGEAKGQRERERLARGYLAVTGQTLEAREAQLRD